MVRSFRFYQKKRGTRRTGSDKLGSVWEALFFGVFFLLGCGGLAVMVATLVVPEWRANHEFVRTDCVVCARRVGERQGEDGTLYRPEVQIEYQIGAETHRVWTYDIHTIRGGGYSTSSEDARTALLGFTLDRQYRCYYDRSDPNVAVLVRGSTWWVWLSLVVPVSFMLIGAGGLAYTICTWGKSAERRAVIGKQAGQGLSGEAGPVEAAFPSVPVAAKITDSPGTRLAFRLPAVRSPMWVMAAWLAACVLWNGIVFVFVAMALSSFLEGHPDWLLTVFIFPFVVTGMGLVIFFLRKLVVTTAVGPTLIEVSDQPLHPGERYRLFLSQPGRLKMNRLELFLVCDEETTYRHGTDTRTESRRVCQQPLLRRENFEVRAAAPLETDCDLVVPAGAMHSFKSGHNQIAWKILVKGSPARWPAYERSFPVIVHPSRNGNRQP